MHSSKGRQVSRSVAAPPTQKTNVASAAGLSEPVTGASRKRMPRAGAAAAISLENDGLTVLQSTHNRPGANLERNPSSPTAAFATAWVGASIVKIISACVARSAGDSAH